RLLGEKPESFAEIDREYQAAEAETAKLNESLEALNKERRRVDGELQDQQELLKKYQGQLMQVKNQQQYAAAWKEIDATRKHVKELEESDLKNMGEAEGLQKQLDDRKESFTDLQARHDAEYAAWQGSLSHLRAEAEQLRARTAKIESSIPDPLKQEFHRIYKQRQHIGVAQVINDTCSACRTRIRPALAQQLKRSEMVHCEGCYRILYLEKAS
ncbi:MAG: Zn-ribbon protein, nucleic acid-binding protein, partial [Acidobacteria bacterium]|nr:Zn-ribbon protein, nucleic acid-binding protein [Acidobacteriota bacterium]